MLPQTSEKYLLLNIFLFLACCSCCCCWCCSCCSCRCVLNVSCCKNIFQKAAKQAAMARKKIMFVGVLKGSATKLTCRSVWLTADESNGTYDFSTACVHVSMEMLAQTLLNIHATPTTNKLSHTHTHAHTYTQLNMFMYSYNSYKTSSAYAWINQHMVQQIKYFWSSGLVIMGTFYLFLCVF